MRQILKRFLLYLAVTGIVIWTVAPYLWLIISSLSYKIDLLTVPLRWIPPRLTMENYYSLFFMRGSESVNAQLFIHSLGNSAMISLTTTLICLFLGVLAAYAIARLRFKGSNGMVLVTMATQLVPPIVLVVPMYVIMRRLIYSINKSD